MKYDLRDYLIVPETNTNIKSRDEIDPYYYVNNIVKLPIFTAPMHSVISVNSKHFNADFLREYNHNKLNIILPRNFYKHNDFDSSYKDCFISVSLSEFQMIIDFFKNEISPKFLDNYLMKLMLHTNILIDMANGHIKEIEYNIKEYKMLFPEKIIMVGNVANPKTYYNLAVAGADYVRISIGSGDVCLTSSNTAVGYPIGSLIKECKEIKNQFNLETKIVADGGMKNYSDIIKALALGADYVMLGSLINKSFESDSVPYLWKKIPIYNYKLAEFLFDKGFPLYKKHIGMSTKEIQKMWGNKKLKTSEGKVKWNKVEYSLSSYIDNFIDYLKSAMSYTDANNLQTFINETQTVLVSSTYLNRINY